MGVAAILQYFVRKTEYSEDLNREVYINWKEVLFSSEPLQFLPCMARYVKIGVESILCIRLIDLHKDWEWQVKQL